MFVFFFFFPLVAPGTTDERAVEPTAETDDGRLVPAAEDRRRGRGDAVGRAGPGLPGHVGRQTGRGGPGAVAAVVPAAGVQLPGLPAAAGRGQRVAGERDRQAGGPVDRGHGQGAQPVLRQGGVRAVHARQVGHAPGHGVRVRAEQRDGGRVGLGPAGRRLRRRRRRAVGRAELRRPRARGQRGGHLRHVLVPAAVAQGRGGHGVRRVLQEPRLRVLGQQRRAQLRPVGAGAVRRTARPRHAHAAVPVVVLVAAVAAAPAPVPVFVVPVAVVSGRASRVLVVVRLRRRRRRQQAARPLFRRALQTQLVGHVPGPEEGHVRVLVNAARVRAG